ncbi:hypothetical protein U8326_09645 [Tsuneonella sp. CC-YZS046]|uniref:hypothetical protein n=1 Tax=Tsuneonella sp. CC-YZS046 TaxID=3042152 RepID=UPI002D77B9A8|nr:hypothetical protein [Tsuneonella sp. CC-YZS046]WRO65336.1 hypothetical protein U8326_09645 [Tsuneonella sp. CC-YZS046]
MDRFPALRLILRFGRLWSLFVAIAATGALAWLLVGSFGLAGYAAIPLGLPFFYFMAKSYVELIQIVVEMVH